MSDKVNVLLRVGILNFNLKIQIVIQCYNLGLNVKTSNIFSSCPLCHPDHAALVLSEAELPLCCHCDHHLAVFLNYHIFLYCTGGYRYPVLRTSSSVWGSAFSSSFMRSTYSSSLVRSTYPSSLMRSVHPSSVRRPAFSPSIWRSTPSSSVRRSIFSSSAFSVSRDRD